MKPRDTREILAALSLPAWVASLFFQALATSEQEVSGLQLLIGGAFGPLVGEFAWYANPAYFLSLYFLMKRQAAPCRVAAIASVVLAALPIFNRQVWLNEGYPSPVIGFGLGFYLWLGAILLAATAAWLPTRGGARVAAPTGQGEG